SKCLCAASSFVTNLLVAPFYNIHEAWIWLFFFAQDAVPTEGPSSKPVSGSLAGSIFLCKELTCLQKLSFSHLFILLLDDYIDVYYYSRHTVLTRVRLSRSFSSDKQDRSLSV